MGYVKLMRIEEKINRLTQEIEAKRLLNQDATDEILHLKMAMHDAQEEIDSILYQCNEMNNAANFAVQVKNRTAKTADKLGIANTQEARAQGR